MREASKKVKELVRETDLRAITRHPELCRTTVVIRLDWQTQVKWLVFGQAQLQRNERTKECTLKAYLPEGVTDFEHDSAYALRLPLIGWEFDSVYYHLCSFNAWIDPNIDTESDFRVPRPGYNPMEHPEAERCEGGGRCDGPHIIVPESMYGGPPFDPDLYQAVRGKRVEVQIGAAYPDEED